MWRRATGRLRRRLAPAGAAAVHALFPTLKAEAEKGGVDARVHGDRPAAGAGAVPNGKGRRAHRYWPCWTGFRSDLRWSWSAWASRSSSWPGSRFNINSPKQLGEVLFKALGLPAPVSYGKGKTISTAQDVLEELAEQHDVPRLVLEYRHLSKLKSNYIDALPLLADAESRVHTTFQAAATATGRLSSVNPNLQNIPIRTELGREIRAAFTAAPGTQLLSADYSQIELRLLAHF